MKSVEKLIYEKCLCLCEDYKTKYRPLLNWNRLSEYRGGLLTAMCFYFESVFKDKFEDGQSKFVPVEEMGLVGLLNAARFLTYIPFGELGYAKLDELVRAHGEYSCLAELRWEEYRESTKVFTKKFPKGCDDCVKEYFYEYMEDIPQSQSQIMADIILLERAFAQIECTQDPMVVKKGTQIYEEFWGVADMLVDQTLKLREDKVDATIPRCLEVLPSRGQLTDEEVDFLWKSVMGDKPMPKL